MVGTECVVPNSLAAWPDPRMRAMIARLVATQAHVPASPGAVVEGKPLLCLAACAVEAGLLVRGDASAVAAFRQRAARSTDKAVLYDAFHDLGWPQAACEAALRFNDRQAPAVRKQRILEALAEAQPR